MRGALGTESLHTGPFGGRWRVDGIAGQGGMSVVYAVTDLRSGRRAALKVVQQGLVGQSIAESRMLNEIIALLMLADHPHVVRILDVGPDPAGGAAYLAMEWLAGGSASDHLRERGPMTQGSAAGYMIQVLAALDAAHRRGIVHRDVKPSNVLLGARHRAVLADFGVALVPGGGGEPSGVLGSVPFMAPEQLVDPRSVGPTADLYAVGSTLFRLATGLRMPELWQADPADSCWDAVAAGLGAVIRRAVSESPAARYDDARAMALDLLPLVDDALLDWQPHVTAWLQRPPPWPSVDEPVVAA